MVILDIFGKIEPICISEKMGIYISNLPKTEDDNWNEYIVDEFKRALSFHKLECESLNVPNKLDIKHMYEVRCLDVDRKESLSEEEMIQEIVNGMICIYLDYSYEEMPMGDWHENPFDGRLCEKDYCEMIVEFLCFVLDESMGRPPTWIYSSNYDREWPYYRLCFNSENADEKIELLKNWGQKLDGFLEGRNDYLKFDYIVRSVCDLSRHDAYDFIKLYALCQLFLENKNESELDKKLPQFLDLPFTMEEKTKIAILLRQMRNKIAHGDFIALEHKAEEYAQTVLDGRFDFDYSEYSRKNWVLGNACCMLQDTIRRLIMFMFENKTQLDKIKNS